MKNRKFGGIKIGNTTLIPCKTDIKRFIAREPKAIQFFKRIQFGVMWQRYCGLFEQE